MSTSPTLYLFVVALIGAYVGLFGGFDEKLWRSVSLIFVPVAIFSKHQGLRALSLLCFCAALVAGLATTNFRHSQERLARLPLTEAIYEGTVSDLTPTLDRGRQATLRLSGVIDDQARRALPLTLTLFLREGAAAVPLGEGDRVRVQGKARRLQHALSPGEFDAFWFGVARGIDGTISTHDPFAIVVMQKNVAADFFATVRHNLRSQLLLLTTPREASVLLALIVGDTQLFDDDQRQIYRDVGAGHLLAVSGLQISLLAYLFFRFFQLLLLFTPRIGRLSRARPLAALFAIVAIWVFTLLCGAPPSAVRAAFMASIFLIGAILARHTLPIDAFSIAGLFTILLFPTSVVDPSFLLSYAAVFGLILVDKPQGLLAPVVASISAGIMTMPISAHLFGQVAAGGVVANIFLVPLAVMLQTPAIFLGVVGAGLSNTTLVNWGANCAGFLEAMCDLFRTPLGHVMSFTAPSGVATVGLFIAAFFFIVAVVHKGRPRFLLLSLLMLCIVFLPTTFSPDGVRITLLPVGQGDASVFEFPSGQVVIVDGGGVHDRSFDPGQRVVVPFLQRRGIRHVDVVAITHPDADHLLGLLAVVQNFSVGEIWHSGFDESNWLMAEMLSLARQKNIRVRSGQELWGRHEFGQAQIEVLAPRPQRGQLHSGLSTNDNSLVLRISLGTDHALWTGDIEEQGESRLLGTAQDLRADVVKAPHHGSKTSSTPGFVNAVSAKHVIFCTKDNNMWGFPHSQIVKRWQARGANIWNTGTHGEITVWLTGHGVRVNAFNEDHYE